MKRGVLLRCIIHHLACVAFLGAIAACNAPPPEPAPAPRVEEKKAVPALSRQQLLDRSEKCSTDARNQFRRAWKDGKESTPEGVTTAEFTSHYNEKLNTCFYLLTVTSPGTLKKMLFDANGGELYGEYLGPAIIESPATSRPKECRVESFYCASWREWEVLIESYMED